jgi:outer membrane protein assembly factor BamB
MVRLWNFSTGARIAASPAVVHGVAYIGSWNGYEYALNASNGALLWKTYLGIDPYGNRSAGISSSATVSNGVLYLAGGNSSWYAVRASNGAILWNVTTGSNILGYYGWASPLIANGFAYIGLASKGDNPLVYAGLLQVSLKTHPAVHFFNTTANGTVGASIWTSPAFNAATRTVFVTTGNEGPNGSVFADSILSFNASTLHLVGSWRVPANQTIYDGDFGATPLLFKTANGTPMVVASNKNGILYAWNQNRLSAGPVWERTLAFSSRIFKVPNLGPAAWSPGHLYVGTSLTQIGGVNYSGSVRALAANSGKLLWEIPETAGPVYAPPEYANGILAVEAGTAFQVVDASSGSVLFHFNSSGGKFQGPAAIAHGEIVVGADDGQVYGFGLKSCIPGGGLEPNSPVPQDSVTPPVALRT